MSTPNGSAIERGDYYRDRGPPPPYSADDRIAPHTWEPPPSAWHSLRYFPARTIPLRTDHLPYFGWWQRFPRDTNKRKVPYILELDGFADFMWNADSWLALVGALLHCGE